MLNVTLYKKKQTNEQKAKKSVPEEPSKWVFKCWNPWASGGFAPWTPTRAVSPGPHQGPPIERAPGPHAMMGECSARFARYASQLFPFFSQQPSGISVCLKHSRQI